MSLRKTGILILTLAAFSCRSDNGGTPDAQPSGTPDAGGSVDASLEADAATSGGMTIKALLASNPQYPDMVTVKGVVVVAKKPPSSTTAEIWVQDPGGGLSSGMHIYCNTGAHSNPCPEDLADIAALKLGDVVDISGIFSNNDFNSHPDDYEIIAATITPTGGTMTPAAMVVDAAMVAKGAYSAEGFINLTNVLVKVNGPLTVTSVMADQYGTTSCHAADGDAGTPPDGTYYLYGFEGDIGGQTIAVGIRYPDFTTCMPDCTTCAGSFQCAGCMAEHQVQVGEKFQFIQGIAYGNRQVGSSFAEIQPVSDADLPPQ